MKCHWLENFSSSAESESPNKSEHINFSNGNHTVSTGTLPPSFVHVLYAKKTLKSFMFSSSRCQIFLFSQHAVAQPILIAVVHWKLLVTPQ